MTDYTEQDLWDNNETKGIHEVPTTDVVRGTYATDYWAITVSGRETPMERARDFDTWLAGVCAEAWDEGAQAMLDEATPQSDLNRNPHRRA